MPPVSMRELKHSMLRTKEELPYGVEVEAAREPSTIEIHFGRVTSTTTTAGKYPGKRYDLTDPTTNPVTWTEREVCWIRRPNVGELLGVGSTPINWSMKLVGTHSDGKAIYQALDFVRLFRGALAGALAFGGTANFTTSDGQTIVVYGGLMVSGDPDVASGTTGYAAWNAIEARWDLINAACPVA